MTMHPPASPLLPGQYQALVSAETARLAALASKWGVEAVGREYPVSTTHAGAGGYRYVVKGKWYVVRVGQRQRASAAQARALNAATPVMGNGVGSIYPVMSRSSCADK